MSLPRHTHTHQNCSLLVVYFERRNPVRNPRPRFGPSGLGLCTHDCQHPTALEDLGWGGGGQLVVFGPGGGGGGKG